MYREEVTPAAHHLPFQVNDANFIETNFGALKIMSPGDLRLVYGNRVLVKKAD